jgi:hypothetical protein
MAKRGTLGVGSGHSAEGMGVVGFRRLLTGGGVCLVLGVLALYSGFLGSRRGDGGIADGSINPPPVVRPPPRQGGDAAESQVPRQQQAVLTPPVAAVAPSVAAVVPPARIPLPFTSLADAPLSTRAAVLPPPHGGGELVNLVVTEARRQELESAIASGDVKHTWTLTPRQACDAELLLTGGFTPLRGFMTQAQYASVVSDMRLPPTRGTNGADVKGALWPMPITLDLPAALTDAMAPGDRIALRDAYHNLIAVMMVEDVWVPDREAEAAAVFGTTDESHPGGWAEGRRGIGGGGAGVTSSPSGPQAWRTCCACPTECTWAGSWRASLCPSTTTTPRCAARPRRCN